MHSYCLDVSVLHYPEDSLYFSFMLDLILLILFPGLSFLIMMELVSIILKEFAWKVNVFRTCVLEDVFFFFFFFLMPSLLIACLGLEF